MCIHSLHSTTKGVLFPTGFVLTVLTVDGPLSIELPCKLQDDMSIVIENKGVPYADGRGIHHVGYLPFDADAAAAKPLLRLFASSAMALHQCCPVVTAYWLVLKAPCSEVCLVMHQSS